MEFSYAETIDTEFSCIEPVIFDVVPFTSLDLKVIVPQVFTLPCDYGNSAAKRKDETQCVPSLKSIAMAPPPFFGAFAVPSAQGGYYDRVRLG